METIIAAFTILAPQIPNIVALIQHYEQIAKSDALDPVDKDKAKQLLEQLRWRAVDEIT